MNVTFYFDVHVPRQIAKALRNRGVDVLTAQDDGAGTLDDGLLLLRASALGRVLVSQDEDLLREGGILQQSGVPFAGVVYGHQMVMGVGRMVEDLTLIAAASLPSELANQIWYLPL